jgi:signal peptidase I
MKVDGISMEPTFYDGSVIFVNKVFSNINKDDIVLFYHNGNKLVKRVLGIEGDIV